MRWSSRFKKKGAGISGFCQKRFSALGDSEKRRCFRRFDHNDKDHKTHWEEGGSGKQRGGLWRLIR